MTRFALLLLPALILAQKISKHGRCGPNFGTTCEESRFGDCCSQYSYCGSTDTYCNVGCQSGYGICSSSPPPSSMLSSTPTSSSDAASSTPSLTPNARCGNGFGFSCQGSLWGNCCSHYSWCGSSESFCGTGCQNGFSACDSNPSSALASSSSSIAATLSSSSTSAMTSSSSTTSSFISSASQSSSSGSSSVPTSTSGSTVSSSSTSTTISSASSTAVSSSTSSSTSSISSSVGTTSTSSTIISSSSSAPSDSAASSPTSGVTPSSSSTSSSSSTFSTSSTPASPISTLPSSIKTSSTSSHSPSPTCATPINIFSNPSFETGSQSPWVSGGTTSGYTASIQTTGGHDGNDFYAIKFTSVNGVVSSLGQPVALSKQITVQASGWAKLQGLSLSPLRVTWTVDGENKSTTGNAVDLSGGEGWKHVVSDPFVLTVGSTHNVFMQVVKAATPSPSGYMEFDDFSLTVVCGS